jgi:hypothetical protein
MAEEPPQETEGGAGGGAVPEADPPRTPTPAPPPNGNAGSAGRNSPSSSFVGSAAVETFWAGPEWEDEGDAWDRDF